MFKMRKTLKMVVFSLRAARRLHLTVEKKKTEKTCPRVQEQYTFCSFYSFIYTSKMVQPTLTYINYEKQEKFKNPHRN